MKQERPNILLLMTDQQRGDCLGIEGHPVLQTPWLDALAAGGTRFTRAYSECPICVPARRTLLTGRKPINHGVFFNHEAPLPGPTLPQVLGQAGYQAHVIGKMHMWPKRKLYGFHSADWADGLRDGIYENDYFRFLMRQGIDIPRVGLLHGLDGNGWVSRPWPLEESLHLTNWTADCAVDFLDRRDPTLPFFLKVSFTQPHQPCAPPAYYFDKYMAMDLPSPVRGDWADVDAIPRRGMPVASSHINLDPIVMKQYMAGYFGSIEHIDHQIGRILQAIPANTIVLFVSDHGEMLGDHGYSRKTQPFEGAARIPFLLRLPPERETPRGRTVDQPVGLMDVMPTLLDAAGVEAPNGMDGCSVLPLTRGDTAWRDFIHGEVAVTVEPDNSLRTGMQYLTDGHQKYIWYPGTGRELFFDLDKDPRELCNRINEAPYAAQIGRWRSRLVAELSSRPEGFTDGKTLTPTGGPTRFCTDEISAV